MTDKRAIPKSSLAYLFPKGFNEFWTKCQFKPDLEQVKYDYAAATATTEEMWKTLMSGYGLNAVFIAKHYFAKYQYRTFEPYEDVFVNEFKTEIIFVIAEIRRKEWLWQDTFRQIKKWAETFNIRETQTNQGVDKSNRNKQENIINSKSALLSREVVNKENRTDNFNLSGWDQKGTKRTINRQEKNLIPLTRLLSNFQLTLTDFSQYNKRFDRLFVKFFGASVMPVIDPLTGKRKWVSEVEYIEITEPAAQPLALQGDEWDETLPYLQRLKMLLSKTEKEYNKLPDTSNRKPRIGLRLKNLEGCVEAYEKEYISLPTADEFLARIRGEVKGFARVIGYENIIKTVVGYLSNYHFAKKYGIPAPAQLMIMLLGEPGLGKTYISQVIAKALGRGFHMVGMNGKLNASLITGTDIENPGAEPGEVLKAIARRKDRGVVIVFDEIEKAARECKEACGIPTDITTNQNYQDTFLDFPTPTNECIFIATVNRPQDVPNFVADRFAIREEVLPLAYAQRLEVIRVVLQSELKKLEPAFLKIYKKKWEDVYSNFDNERLLKKTLTWTFSIRGAKNNILLKLIPVFIKVFLEPEKVLNQNELINYNWGFLQREGKDENCPYAKDKRNKHKKNCMCFVQNLNLVPGWKENMGEKFEG